MSNTITQVTEKNNWEQRTYFAGKLRLTPEATESVVVSWPDGRRELCPVNWNEETHSYEDHGHRSTVRSMVPSITARHSGLLLTIKLSRLEIIL